MGFRDEQLGANSFYLRVTSTWRLARLPTHVGREAFLLADVLSPDVAVALDPASDPEVVEVLLVGGRVKSL